jgi:thioredoxin 1
MITIDETEFPQEVLQSQTPVLVDFSAVWCGPCKKQADILTELTVLKKDLKVVKIDVDDCPTLASQFGVRSLPTMILFKDGKPADKKVGLTSLNSLLELVK